MAKLLICIFLTTQVSEAFTSDFGIKSEVIYICVQSFCKADIAQDLKPLMVSKRQLMRSKMSQESLKRELLANDRIWGQIKKKNKKFFSELNVRPEIGKMVSEEFRRLYAAEAWEVLQKECPSKLNEHVAQDYIEEFLSRVLPDLKTLKSKKRI